MSVERTIAKKVLAGIPCLTCRADEGQRKPLVILLHGFTGSKENFTADVRRYAEYGFLAVALDNRLHGERPGPKWGEVAVQNGKLDMYQVRKAMQETADDVVMIINHLIDQGRADAERIAVAGGSMGGCITFRVVAIDDRIKAAAPIIGTPYWEDIPGDAPVLSDNDNMAKLKELVEEYNPARFPERFFPTALLIQINEKDPHVNRDKVRRFYDILKPYYVSTPNKLEFIEYPELAHEYTPEMGDSALQWIRKFI